MELNMSIATKRTSSDLYPEYSSSTPSKKVFETKEAVFFFLSTLPGAIAIIMGLAIIVGAINVIKLALGGETRELNVGFLLGYLSVIAVLVFAVWLLLRCSTRLYNRRMFYYDTLVEGTIVQITEQNADEYKIEVTMTVEGKNRAGKYLRANVPIEVAKWRAKEYIVGEPYEFDSSTVE
jgi:hypothetical protein